MAATSTLTVTGVAAITFTQPVTWHEEEIERAIVVHRIPTQEDDVVQDMGRYSPTYRLQGLCTLTERALLRTMASTPQIATNGITTFLQTDDAGNIFDNLDKLCIISLTNRPIEGMPQRFTFTMRLVRTNQS